MSVLGSAGKGAMSGASIGSIVPGIVTGIGAAIGGVAGLFGGMFGHHSQPKQTVNGMPQGARLEDILPILLPLLKQSQQYSDQNYALQQRRYLMTDPGAASLMPGAQVPQGALPLQEMVARMTSNIMPNSARRG